MLGCPESSGQVTNWAISPNHAEQLSGGDMNFHVGKEGVKAVGQTRMTPVAVIGKRCRLPGGFASPELLWGALLRGDDLIVEVPPTAGTPTSTVAPNRASPVGLRVSGARSWITSQTSIPSSSGSFFAVRAQLLRSKALLDKCPEPIS
jgi:hypothetical protein